MFPGVYDNNASSIFLAAANLERHLKIADIPLKIVIGADIHVTPNMATKLRSGELLTLNGSRYFLLEFPSNFAPPRMHDTVFNLLSSGYTPIITHPERLAWIEDEYDLMDAFARSGAWMQVTAGSLTGRFGRRIRYWSERLLNDGLVHILATDAHDCSRRPPRLHNAFLVAERYLGADEAERLVNGRPAMVMANADPSNVAPPPQFATRGARSRNKSRWRFWRSAGE